VRKTAAPPLSYAGRRECPAAVEELNVYAGGLRALLDADDPDPLRRAVRPLPIDPLVAIPCTSNSNAQGNPWLVRHDVIHSSWLVPAVGDNVLYTDLGPYLNRLANITLFRDVDHRR
jgi:hypothetical protein